MNIVKTMAIWTPIALLSLLTTYCNNNGKFSEYDNKFLGTDTLEEKYTQQEESNTNIPFISDSILQYRNLTGKTLNGQMIDDATVSLYKAMQASTANSVLL